MSQVNDWIDPDRWLSDAEWLEFERCLLEWHQSGEPVPPPVQLAKLEPLVQRLLECTLSSGRNRGKYVPPPGGMFRLTPDAIERLYDTESRWQEYLTRDCDRMLRPLSGADARLLVAIRGCNRAAPIGPQLRQAVRHHLEDALARAGQDGAKAMVKRRKTIPHLNINQLTAEEQTWQEGDDHRSFRSSPVEPEARRSATIQVDDDTPRGAAIDLASIKRLEYTMAALLSDEERKPCVLTAIIELDQQSRARADMAPPALLFLDDFRCRKLSGFAWNVAISLRLFVGRHSQTGEALTLREACAALRSHVDAISRARSIPISSAFDTMNQPVLWEVLRELGVPVETSNTMTVRLKRTRRRLLERVLELVRDEQRGRAGARDVTTETNRPKEGGDHT